MKLDLSTLGLCLKRFFEPQWVQTMARQSKFVQRVSALSGSIFLQAWVFSCLEQSQVTLKHLAQSCLDLGVVISPQGVDERINGYSVQFMEAMFQEGLALFRHQQGLPLAILSQFTALNIFDSTVITLPAVLAAAFPGCGGNASPASVKVQLGLEFLRGHFKQLALRPGKEVDQSYEAYLSLIEAGSLNLIDLGYFKVASLQTIADRLAYFLCPYLAKTGLLTPQGEPIDLLNWLQSAATQPVERTVLLGSQHHLPCRLLAFPLTQEAADRRRYKAKQKAKREGKAITKPHLALLGWFILVSNVPDTMLTLAQVPRVYRIRWQIELTFKLWKSYGGLRHLAGWRQERLLTELYARLIGLVLTQFLLAPLRLPFGPAANREVSPVQVRKILQRFARLLNQALLTPDRLLPLLQEMFSHISRFGFKDKRRKKPNLYYALHLAAYVFSLPLPVEADLDLLPFLA